MSSDSGPQGGLPLIGDVFRKAAGLVRQGGLRRLPQYLTYGLSELYNERRLGIHTLGYLDENQLGFTSKDNCIYAPTAYRDFHKAMKLLPLHEGLDTFVDYGSGMGRAVVLAATYPLRRVIGVEYSQPLHAIAQNNVDRARSKLRCDRVELLNMDAAKFDVPSDVTIAYFYNPFRGELLRQVMANLRRSLQESPRILYVVFKNESHLREGPPQPWLTEYDAFNCITGHRCVIYRAAA